MNVYDQAARYAAKLDPEGFCTWLLDDLSRLLEFAGWLDTRTLPFPGERDRTCDTVARLRERSADAGTPRNWAAPIEFQSEPEPDMLERLLEYAVRLRREVRPGEDGAQKYEIAGVLVNLTGRRQSARWRSGLPRPSRAALTWTVEVRTMAQEDAGGLLAEIEAERASRCLLPWIPLMKGADRPDVIEAWKRIASVEPHSRRRSDYGALALVFADLAKRSRPWKEALRSWNMKESPQVLEWQEEARREAREETLRQDLIHVLEVRFQRVPDDVRSRIDRQADVPTLRRWFDLALRTDDLEVVRRELQATTD